MAPTMTMESVTIVRPVKVFAFICALIAVILIIVSVAPTSWIKAKNFQQGLWQTCRSYDNSGLDKCTSQDQTAWIQACAALCIISAIVSLAAALLTAVGLRSTNINSKYKFYRVAMYLMFFAVLCQVVALIVFPVMFIQNLQKKSQEEKITEWYFAWAYGIGWGGAIFETGAAILLLLDKETEELYYMEKTKYNSAA